MSLQYADVVPSLAVYSVLVNQTPTRMHSNALPAGFLQSHLLTTQQNVNDTAVGRCKVCQFNIILQRNGGVNVDAVDTLALIVLQSL